MERICSRVYKVLTTLKAHSMFSVSNLQPEVPPSIAFFLIFIQLTHTFTKFVFQTNFLW